MLNQDVALTDTTSVSGDFRAPFQTIARAFAAWRRARARRLALVALLQMDPERLDDLGLSVQDVADALDSRRPL